MRKALTNYVQHCDVCQKCKWYNHKSFGLLKPPKPTTKKQKAHNQIFFQATAKVEKRNTCVLEVSYQLSKMMHLFPFPKDLLAPKAVHFILDHIYEYRGLPSVIMCDKGPVFLSMCCYLLFHLLQTKITPFSANLPETECQTYTLNRKSEEMIRAYVDYDKLDWDLFLTHIKIAYNSLIHTYASFTPFYLNYDHHRLVTPLETSDTKNRSAGDFLIHIRHCEKIAKTTNQNDKMDFS